MTIIKVKGGYVGYERPHTGRSGYYVFDISRDMVIIRLLVKLL